MLALAGAALSMLASTPGGGPSDRSSAKTSEWSAATSCSQPSGRMPHCCAIEQPAEEEDDDEEDDD